MNVDFAPQALSWPFPSSSRMRPATSCLTCVSAVAGIVFNGCLLYGLRVRIALPLPVSHACHVFTRSSNWSALTHAGKEYSKADSRYLTRDDFVISMEFCTAFVEGDPPMGTRVGRACPRIVHWGRARWPRPPPAPPACAPPLLARAGPACILIVWALLARKPWRYNAITLVSLGQLYGDVLYFGTCIHGGKDVRARAPPRPVVRGFHGPLQPVWLLRQCRSGNLGACPQ